MSRKSTQRFCDNDMRQTKTSNPLNGGKTMASISRVRERTEEQSSAMTQEQQSAIRMLANDLHRLNQAVMNAVEAGVSVELVRSARHHGGDGNWGDLMIPVIVAQGKAAA
jgi:hypothetical protein